MMKVKRLVSLFVCSIMLVATFLTSGITIAFADEKQVLTIFSVEDYIHEGEDDEKGVLEIFEDNENIEVRYLTFATNEDMYNELKKDPYACEIGRAHV